MSIRLFSKRRPTLEELESIREGRSLGIRRVLGVSGLIFLAFVTFLVSMLVLQPLIELKALEREREVAEYQLKQAKAEEERQQSIYSSMADPEFFENLARDRGDLAKDGETVVRRATPGQDRPVGKPRRN